MDFLTSGVFWTGVLGVAGIVATFFAPTWTEQKMERRRQRREFVTAQRLVGDELGSFGGQLQAVLLTEGVIIPTDFAHGGEMLEFTEWREHKQALAALLPPEIWREVSTTYHELAATKGVLAAVEPTLPRNRAQLDEDAMVFVKDDIERINSANTKLDSAQPDSN